MDQTRRIPRLLHRALFPLLSLALLLALLFTAHAVLAQPPALPPQDAPWTVPNVKVNTASAGGGGLSAPYAAIAAFNGTTNLVSAWISRTGVGNDDLIFARSTNGGASWIGQTRISTGTVAQSSDPSPAVALAVTGTGTVHAAWLNSGASGHILYYNRSTNGGVTWQGTDTSFETDGLGAAYNPDLAVSGANVYYAWQSNLQIKLAKSINGGATWLAPATVYTPSSDTLWPDLSLAASPTGVLHLVWDQSTNASGMDACYIRSTNGGVTWSARNCLVQLPSSATHTDPDLAIDPADGSLHLVYLAEADGFPVVMHKYSTTGGVSWSTPITVSSPLYSATEPSIVISGSQALYVAWTNSPHVSSGNVTDVYYARSQDNGLTWGAPSQVNDASALPQTHPFLTLGNNGPRAIWSDYRSNSQWDIYSASITGACTRPLTGVAMGGPGSPDPGITATYTAVLTPTDVDLPVSYTWTPAPGVGQGTASAQYNWPVPGSYPITLTASNCGGLVGTSRTIVVQCTAGLFAVGIDGDESPVTAGETVTLTAMPDPPEPNPVVTYSWAPPPLTGQGTAVATYRWQVVGSHPVTVTARNCAPDPVFGYASVVITDTAPPTWGALSPTGWITTTQSPALNVRVTDAQSGLDVSTGQYQFTANAGVTWTGWLAAPVSGGDYTTTSQILATPAVPFGRESTLAGETRIRFQVRDMAGNLGASPDYTVTIDTLPPVNPAAITATNRPTSTWGASFAVTMTWTAATDAFSGVGGYSYLWSTNETDLPPAVISTTALSAATLIPGYGQHWYFHVRAVDNVGHWSPTATHQGPYWVGNAPTAFLTLDPESAGPGAEVILTGFGFDPQVTVNIGFTSTAGIHWLGSVQTSYDGVFQAAATVPDTATVTISGTASTTHGFIAQGGGKTGTAKFSVTRGMQILILNPNDEVKPGGYAWIKANFANKFGSLVLEWAGADYAGPFPMGGVTTRQASLQVPMNALTGTHTLTVTNRVDGYIVQRNTAEFHVVVPAPPTPLTATTPTINLAPNHGIRGTTVQVTGVAPSACGYFTIGSDIYLDCQNTRLFLDLQLTTKPVSGTVENWVAGSTIIPNEVEINGYTGQFTGTLKLLDEFMETTQNELWGAYNLCLFSDQQTKHTGTQLPSSATPSAALALAAPAGQAPALVPQPTLTPVPGEPGESSGGQQAWVTHKLKTVVCAPFRVDMPGNYVEPIRLEDTWGNFINQSKSPQIVVRGSNTGYLTGTHPVKVGQTITQGNQLGQGITINLPEGNYWIDAFACGYVPTTSVQLQNNGRFGFYPTRDINLAPNGGLGPSPRGVDTDFPTALTKNGKIGPFLSFQGALYKPSAPPVVPIEIWFNKNLEYIVSVTVALPGGGSIQATRKPTAPSDPTDVWTATLDVTNFPAGQVSASVTAFGHYIDSTGICPTIDQWSAPWPIPIVMVPAPSWLTRALANPSVVYDSSTQIYTMSGRVGQGVPGWHDWTVIPGKVDLSYLGGITNKITAQVEVAETFDILSGEWKATVTKISGESGILCFAPDSGLPGTADCVQTFPQGSTPQLAASPPGGIVKSAADASMPNSYTWGPGQLSSKTYGPWTVYNGVIASYWGIVNVNLSISFGASSQAVMQATLLNDLRPSPIHIEPSATLNGNISLWVDILLGVASAGVSGQPYLTVGFPADIISDTVSYNDATVCFGLNGEVWASMLWWEASFGPFEIFKTGHCGGMASNLGIMAATPPPSTLPAPSLASDGYGHLLGTWIHNSSADPGQNIGVMYYVYWDGATWSDGAPAIGDASFLISDPEVAFAGPGKALAVFASNAPVSATKPVTWTDVVNQTANQEIAYSVFNGQTWSSKQYLTNATGPSGRVTLAGDPLHGQAMAAWVHDISTPSLKKWVIEYAVYTNQSGTWTPPGPSRLVATPNYSYVLAEPNLAFNSVGEAALVFVSQRMVSASDTITTPFNDNTHRQTGVLKWTPSSQSWLAMMAVIPNGALMPSVAFDLNDRPIVAYSLYDKDKGGGPTGIGNNNLLGYSILSGTQWITKTVGSVRGVERPRVIPLKSDLAVILFRGFGPVNTPEFSGVPMAVTVNPLKPNQAPSKAGMLAGSAGWMYSGTKTGQIGQAGQLVTLGVHNLVPLAAAATMSGASMVPAMSAAGGMVPFAGAADDVMLMNISVLPDLAITATDILVGNTVPVSGTSVPVTVTVRNLGLAATTLPADLKVFQDEGSAGEKLVWSSGQTPAEMLFMDSYTFTMNWQAESGVHKLTARVYPTLAEDLNGENNKASFMVGSPAPPTGLTVSVYSTGPVAGLSWTVSAGTAISGYIVYRGVGTDTLQYVGQSAAPSYLDQGVSVGTHYRYAVSSFTDVGVESAQSAEVSVLVPAGVYMPLVFRGAQ